MESEQLKMKVKELEVEDLATKQSKQRSAVPFSAPGGESTGVASVDETSANVDVASATTDVRT